MTSYLSVLQAISASATASTQNGAVGVEEGSVLQVLHCELCNKSSKDCAEHSLQTLLLQFHGQKSAKKDRAQLLIC